MSAGTPSPGALPARDSARGNVKARRALHELEATTAELVKARATVKRLEATRDRRIVRAVTAGVSRAQAARVAGVARPRVVQIMDAASPVTSGNTDGNEATA